MSINNVYTQNNSLRDLFIKMVIFLGVITTIASFFTNLPFLCGLTFLTLFFIIKMFWQSPASAFLVLAFTYQTLQISGEIFALTFLDENFFLLKNVETLCYSYILGLMMLLTLGFGIFLSLQKTVISTNCFTLNNYDINIHKVLYIYIIFEILSPVIYFLSRFLMSSGTLFSFYNIFILIVQLFLFYSCIKEKKYNWIFFIVLYEVIIGMVSFFSSFKVVFFYLVLTFIVCCFWGNENRIKLKHIILSAIIFSIVLLLGLTWTAIKEQQRLFVSGNTGVQVVSVSKSDALKNWIYLANNTDISQEVGLTLLKRISYASFLGYVMENVPRNVPHQYGKESLRAVLGLVPRFLYKNKEQYNDSEDTIKYTNMPWASVEQNTSISIGWVAYCYVDWGVWGMFIFILLIGLGIGRVFSLIYCTAANYMLGTFELASFFTVLLLYESSFIKVFISFVQIVLFWLFFNAFLRKTFIGYITTGIKKNE